MNPRSARRALRGLARGLARGAVAALVLAAGVPAHAQEGEGTVDPEPARVTLAAIDPVVASGTQVGWAVVVEHRGEDEWERIEVLADLHAALGSRSALRSALAGGAVPPSLQRTVTAAERVTPLGPGGVLRIAGSVRLDGSALTAGGSGVHPLRLRVVADGEEVGRIDTAIVRVGTSPSATLATTIVWPLTSPPARGPDGDPAAVLDPATVPGGRLDTLLTALAPVTGPVPTDAGARLAPGIALVVPAHLVEDLTLRAAAPAPAPDVPPDEGRVRAALLLERIRSAVLALPAGPVTTPYADADLGRLQASGPTGRTLAARAAGEGAARLPDLVGRPVAPVVVLAGSVVPSLLDLLPQRTVLIPHAAIEGPDLALDVPLEEPVRALRSPTGRLVTGLIADPYLTVALGTSTRAEPGDPVLAAQEVLVRTAMVHLEAPGRTGRTLVLLPPDGFDPDPRFAAELLARLAAAPWLTPLPPERLAVTDEPAGPARLAELTAEPLPAPLVAALTATIRDLEVLVGAVELTEGTDDGVIPVGGRALRDAADELMRATSRATGGDVERPLALLTGVRAGVDAAFGTVGLRSEDVTLTDREGTVPITLDRTGGVPIRVRLEVSGPGALVWTDGRVREIALGVDGQRAVEVPVRAGASGRFPVRVRVTDPIGQRVLAEDVIGLRATAVAGPALVLIAATVLILTVIGTLRQRRRGLAWRTTADAIGEEVPR